MSAIGMLVIGLIAVVFLTPALVGLVIRLFGFDDEEESEPC